MPFELSAIIYGAFGIFNGLLVAILINKGYKEYPNKYSLIISYTLYILGGFISSAILFLQILASDTEAIQSFNGKISSKHLCDYRYCLNHKVGNYIWDLNVNDILIVDDVEYVLVTKDNAFFDDPIPGVNTWFYTFDNKEAIDNNYKIDNSDWFTLAIDDKEKRITMAMPSCLIDEQDDDD